MNQPISPPARALVLPPWERVRMDNGMTVLLVPRRGLPLVTFEVVLRAGAAGDPPGKEGLTSTTFALLRKGTRRRSGEAFSAAVDSAGALYGASVDQDHAFVTAEFLSRDAEEGLGLVAEALTTPTFPAEEVEKRTRLAIDAIRDDKDYPPAVISRYYDAALFDGHPYGRPVGGDEASLARITRADVASLHASAVRPDSMIVAVAGDFERDTMLAMLERAFGATGAPSARPASPAAHTIPAAAPVLGTRVVLVDKPDEETGYFRFGNVGIAFDDPDWALANLARTVLGGSFTSWLNMALRVDEGLTYGVQADLSRRRRRGPFSISSFSRVDLVERAIAICRAQLERLHADGIDEPTLAVAKSYIKGQFPLAIETADQVAEAYARFEAYGVPQEWIAEYLDRIARATAEEVSTAARRIFPRDDLVFAMIGPAEKLGLVAEKLGSVQVKGIGDVGF